MGDSGDGALISLISESNRAATGDSILVGRIAGVIAVGLPHHVTQRGNGRRAVFYSDEDRKVYLQLLWE
jgi:hypothetical protein